jgi:hypothetical protein
MKHWPHVFVFLRRPGAMFTQKPFAVHDSTSLHNIPAANTSSIFSHLRACPAPLERE